MKATTAPALPRTRDEGAGAPGEGLLFWSVALLVGAAVFVLIFAYHYLDDVTRGRTGTFAMRLLEEGTGAASGLALFVGVVWLYRRWPATRANWRAALPVHLLGFTAFTVAHTTLMWASRSVIAPLAGLGTYDYGRMPVRYLMEAPNDAIAYVVALVVLGLVDARRAVRDRERRAAELERSLAQAELQNLRLRLQPHFLFNALNTIAERMYDDPVAADAMLGRLSELLRHSLRTAHRQEVPLADELTLLDGYLAITRERFGDGLTVRVEAAEDTLRARVPSLVLQPLVENAVRHGRASRSGRGRIDVRAVRAGEQLQLTVENDGDPDGGYAPAVSVHSVNDEGGLGLTATADRLRLLYGERGTCDAGPLPAGGFRVTLALPYRVHDGENAPVPPLTRPAPGRQPAPATRASVVSSHVSAAS